MKDPRRQKAEQLFRIGQSAEEVAAALGVHPRTGWKWQKRWLWEKEKMADPKPRSGRPRNLSVAELEILARTLDKGPKSIGLISPQWKTPLVGQLVSTLFEVQYGSASINRLMRRLGWKPFGAGIIWEKPRARSEEF